MRKLLKVVAWLAGICLVLIAALALVGWHMLGSLCGNEVISETRSPDGRHKVIVFQRDCGATTGFSTQISLLPPETALGNESGNLFVADTNHRAAPSGPGGGPSVVVDWLGADALLITHHPRARVFLAEPKSAGVDVTYRAVE